MSKRKELLTGGKIGGEIRLPIKGSTQELILKIKDSDFYEISGGGYSGVIRQAQPDDAAGLAGLFREAYGDKYPYKKYLTDEGLLASILDPKTLWYLLDLSGKVVCCSNVHLTFWNKSFEAGRTVMIKELQALGIVSAVVKATLEGGLKAGYDMMWGRAINGAIQRIIEKQFGFEPAGIKNGEQKIGRPMVYLVTALLVPSAFEHVVPASHQENPHYQTSIVKDILEKMDLLGVKSVIGEYPEETVVGEAGAEQLHIPCYFDGSNKTLYIRSTGNFQLPDYMEMMVLADKTNFINQMKRFGFRSSCYYPGWYLKDGKRYDCILLENSNNRRLHCNDEYLNSKIRRVIAEFNYQPPLDEMEEVSHAAS